jgi:hypothetical protein
MAPRVRELFVGRSRRDTIIWVAALAIAAFAIWQAARTGTGWAGAIGVAVMAVLYTFIPWMKPLQERNEAARRKRVHGTVTVDGWGVTRVSGDLREAVGWKDLDWVAIRTTGEGPWHEDFFFLLGAADGKGVVVANSLATELNLLATLQERLPGLDNEQVARASGSTTDAMFTIWKRADPPASPPSAPN